VAQVRGKFVPKEMELLQFRGEPYFIAYQPPAVLGDWRANNSINAVNLPQDNSHVFVSVRQGTVMESFGKDAMEQAAKEAMPGVAVLDREWLTAEDDYYHQTTASFELGRHKPAYVFPALRVRYRDADETWLYFTPSLGQMVKFDRRDRANRWWYYGLHAMDWPGLFERRPLWDVVMIVLLAGLGAISVTTLLPAYRRLQKHALRWWKWAFGGNNKHAPSAGWAVSRREGSGGD
jgi:hypothetical protein